MIPVLQPSCTDAEVEAVSKVLRSGWWGNGPVCAEFERELAQRAGYAHAVTVNSATAALHLVLLSCGVGPGDEVIVPALTFVSTALVVSYCGARPVFADVDPHTLCLDWTDVAQVVSERTKALIPVDFAGLSAGADGIWNSWDLPVIEDAAHACLLPHHYGDFVCYSFHPVKNLATGDGGAILTDDPTIASRLKALRWCGIDRDTWQRNGGRYTWDYAIQEIGYKVHWNDIDAAIGLAQLRRYEAMQLARRKIAHRYLEAFDGQGFELPASHPDHAWHLFVLRVADEAERNGLLDFLAARGIAAGVHYKPLTYYPMYADQPTPPVTAREWRRMISLPIFADLTIAQQASVIDAVLDWRQTC